MNKNDIKILQENWELQKERLKNAEHKETMDVSSSCYVEFGVCGISIFKHKKGRWNRKIVNYWKELSFEQFIDNFNETDWEEI